MAHPSKQPTMDSTNANTLTPRTQAHWLGRYGPHRECNIAFSEELELDLRQALHLLTRCRNASGRLDPDLYDAVQTFLHFTSIKNP